MHFTLKDLIILTPESCTHDANCAGGVAVTAAHGIVSSIFQIVNQGGSVKKCLENGHGD